MGQERNRALLPGSVVAYSGLRPAPWRNGGGVTRQVLSGKLAGNGSLEPVSGDDWDWRISIAEVDSDGDFSAFDGMARILTVIEGEGLALTIDGLERWLPRYTALGFDGGSATSAKLPAGPIRDLNLMTRTGTVNGQVFFVELSGEHPQRLTDGQVGILLQGEARLATADGRVRDLERYDTVVGGGEPTTEISGSGLMAVLSMEAAS